MRINILAASDGTPLTKTFTKDGDEIHTSPYPFVKNFDSFEYEISTLKDFRDTLESHASQGHCLLKGTLDRKLSNESRAGHTNAFAKTDWPCFDLDFDTGFDSIDSFLQAVDPALANCSYVLHHSSSSGIKRKPGLSAHLYLKTTQPFSPELLKLWLIKTNLETPELRNQIKLAKNGMSLVFPLDITTCQNDKLLFIADPICHGVDDPMAGKRFELIEKDLDEAPLHLPNLNAQALRDAQDALVAELRAAAGLKKRTPKYKRGGGIEILTNPDQAIVTGVKEGRGFIYLNLNGGDSWAYYFRPDAPELLHNFKGEPAVRLADIAPEFYTQFAGSTPVNAAKNRRAFVFRNPETDTYWNGVYNASDDVIESLYMVKSKDRMKDFMAQYDAPMPDPIEDWRVEFDPRTNTVFDPNRRWVNKFQPTTYMKDKMPLSPKVPRVISKVLRSICVDEETYEHFINWLAYIIQTRKKTGTAWIFHGVPGTGKGILQEKILIPLFGFNHVAKITAQALADDFNGYLEDAMLLLIDEAKFDSRFSAVYDKLKNLVTDHTLAIRLMRSNRYQVTNYVNVIIATNHNDPVPLVANDRRFNVAPAQETPIQISQAEISMIADELPMFAGYLRGYEYDEQKATRILKNEARELMINASETTIDQLFREFKEGNLDYFISNLRDKPSVNPSNTYIDFERAVKRWVAETQNSDKPLNIPRDELMYAYMYLINPKIEPAKFSRVCSIHKLKTQTIRFNGVVLRGFKQRMLPPDSESVAALLSDNVTPIRSAS